MTELRRRMLEELRRRNYSLHSQRAYIRCLANLPSTLKPPQIGWARNTFELTSCSVQQKKLSWSPFNQTVCALRFFYHHVMHRKWMIEHIPYPRQEPKLPRVGRSPPVSARIGSPAPFGMNHRVSSCSSSKALARVLRISRSVPRRPPSPAF
jgi:hypothetical protein